MLCLMMLLLVSENQGPVKKLRSGSNDRSSRATNDRELASLRNRTDAKIFCTELDIYDKFKRCLLTDGEYELALDELSTRTSQHKQATWETVVDVKVRIFNRTQY